MELRLLQCDFLGRLHPAFSGCHKYYLPNCGVKRVPVGVDRFMPDIDRASECLRFFYVGVVLQNALQFLQVEKQKRVLSH